MAIWSLLCLIILDQCFGLRALLPTNNKVRTTPALPRTPTTGILRPTKDKDEDLLYKDLFRDYNQEMRPVVNKEENVTVTLGLTLQQIIDLDEKNQVIKISVWIRQLWMNPLLSWNSSHYGGIKRINVSPKKVWKPDIYLYNNADDSTDGSLEKSQTRVKVSHDGRNTWLLPMIITSSCPIKVKHFPFDEQRCSLKFGSWTYDGFQLDLVREGLKGGMDNFISNGEWQLVDIPVKRNAPTYPCCPEPFPDVTFTIVLQRRYLFYLFNLAIPCFVIVLLTLMSFYLPPESGERISLVITNLLGIAVFMLIVAEILPPTSNEVSILSIFFTCCIIEVGIALIGTCVVLKYHYGDHTIRKMPCWVRHIVVQVLGRFFNVVQKSSEGNIGSLGSTSRKISFVKGENGYSSALIPNDAHDPKLLTDLRKRPNGNSLTPLSGNTIEMEKGPQTLSSSEIADYVNSLAETQDEEDTKKKEWIIAAVVFDKIFFCIFVFSVFLSTLVILCSIPQQQVT